MTAASKYDTTLSRVEGRIAQFTKGWWRAAHAAQEMYEGCKVPENSQYVASADPNPFNILYANTEVLIPSLYSSTPRPDVATKGHHPPEPATAAQTMLSCLLDDSHPGTESFDSAVEGSVLSALVPGAGGVRIRAFPGTSLPVRWEEFKYNQLVWAAGTKWSRLPWIAFLHNMTKEEIIAEFRVAPEKVRAEKQATLDEGQTPGKRADAPDYTVVEVWLRTERKVVFLSREVEDLVLRETDPEFSLPGFFPTPGMLTLVRKPSGLDPTPLYSYYRNQAEELNRVTQRLNRVLAAIKVRGAYNPLLGDLFQQMLSDDSMENALQPTNMVGDLQNKGFDSHIWLLPIEKLVQVAQQLYQARESIKKVIHEITGLADIVRGSTMASETATAQGIKDKWGTIRLRRMQRMVATYVRDLMRLAIDVAGEVMPPEQWKTMTGLPYPLLAEKQAAIQQYQLVASQAELAQQPPPPPPPIVQQPSWEEILSLLVDDSRRNYVIDIEVASTLDSEAQADQEEVTTFITALAQLVQGMSPIAQMGPEGLRASKLLLVALSKKFKFGREVEEAFRKLPEQLPPRPEKDENMAAEKEMAQMDMAMKKEEMAFKREEMKFKMAELARKQQMAEQKHQLDMQKMLLTAKLEAEALQRQSAVDAQKAQQAIAVAKAKPKAGAPA